MAKQGTLGKKRRTASRSGTNDVSHVALCFDGFSALVSFDVDKCMLSRTERVPQPESDDEEPTVEQSSKRRRRIVHTCSNCRETIRDSSPTKCSFCDRFMHLGCIHAMLSDSDSSDDSDDERDERVRAVCDECMGI